MKEYREMTPQQTQSGDYLVLGKDAAEVGDDLMRLASAHWDYIDRFAPQLVARGPLLSSDGQSHMGSVHIITFASSLDAQRFAKEEPYYQANLYSSVTVTRFRNLLRQTMWERAPSVPPEYITVQFDLAPLNKLSGCRRRGLQTTAGYFLVCFSRPTTSAPELPWQPTSDLKSLRVGCANCLNSASCIQIRLNSAAGSEVDDQNSLDVFDASDVESA
jgi:uncharacterized protein YciI